MFHPHGGDREGGGSLPPPQAYHHPAMAPPPSYQPPVPAPTSVPYWASAAHERATYTYTPRPVVKLPPSCLRCKKSKVRCDRNFPCERCRRLNFDCIPQFRPQGRPMKMGRLIGEQGGELCFPGTQHLLRDLYIRVNPRVGVISVARFSGQPCIPVARPSQSSHVVQLAQAWLASGQPEVNTARAHNLLRVWHSYNDMQQRDCTDGLLTSLTEVFGVPHEGGPDAAATGGEGGQERAGGAARKNEDSERVVFDRFVTRAQWDKDGAATCWVTKLTTVRPGRLMVRCNDRFAAQFLSREEMELQLMVLLPELVWERVAHDDCRKTFFRMVAEAGLTVPGMAAESSQMLTVKDRYGMEMLALVRLGMFVSSNKDLMASFCSILPLPHDRNLMRGQPLTGDDEMQRSEAAAAPANEQSR